MKARLMFEPRDLWLGVYWDFRRTSKSTIVGVNWLLDIYVCIVPTLPLRLRFVTYKRENAQNSQAKDAE